MPQQLAKIMIIFFTFFLCLENRHRHTLARHCVYVGGALLLTGPLTPHQIHHTQHIWPLAGTVAPHCSRLISSHLQLCFQGAIWTPPALAPGHFSMWDAGVADQTANFLLTLPPRAGSTKIDAAFSMSAKMYRQASIGAQLLTAAAATLDSIWMPLVLKLGEI